MMGNAETFEGIYVAHWEVPRFTVETARRFFGLLPKIEKWQPIFPEGFQPPMDRQTQTTRSPARYFRMKIRGTLGPEGHFGHKGICSRQLTISEVISCEETKTPGKTW